MLFVFIHIEFMVPDYQESFPPIYHLSLGAYVTMILLGTIGRVQKTIGNSKEEK
jgi:hypothetical protein